MKTQKFIWKIKKIAKFFVRKKISTKLHQYFVKTQSIATSLIVLGTVSCSSPSARERIEAKQNSAHPRAAAYAADGFTLDYRSPEPRPYRAWEFYYKHCNLVSRNPFPTQDEYSCSSPY